ncbi:Uncharacterized protein TPAR_04288 [Tolypocladium paradoxum]|uniref:BPP domain-containing protein n=1 Tax=Tolypocladium paradoxum TaxID=94208 RepID=A0A2S4KZA0_9HYPO|nr:Uncharacterized protein TPAR_04288 [Tolypocladium paradoxum]
MAIAALVVALAISANVWPAQAAATIDVSVTAVTAAVKSHWTTVVYSSRAPLLLSNDGGPDHGGFRTYGLESEPPLAEVASVTKFVATAYGVGGKDLAITIAEPDSVLRVYELPYFSPIKDAERMQLGDWSALCPWKSRTGNPGCPVSRPSSGGKDAHNGDKNARQHCGAVQAFEAPFEASACAASHATSRMFLSTDGDKTVYALSLQKTTAPLKLSKVAKAQEDITGLAVYVANDSCKDYVLVSSEDAISVYTGAFDLVGTMKLSGYDGIEIRGLNVHQASTWQYPDGVVAYAIKSAKVNGFGVTSLSSALE